MSAAPQQLALDLPHRQALEREDFMVSRSNAAALALVDRWPNWQHWAAVVSGPEGAGKSHLAHVWRLKSNAAVVAGTAIADGTVALLERSGALVVEDVERGLANEQILFHLLNLARERKLSILLTTRRAPGDLSISLPDLRSRVRALPSVEIEAPDDALLKAVLVKLFADRQLTVEPHVISYLCVRMERSLGVAAKVVAAADRLALERQRAVTRAIAGAAMAEVIGEGGAE